MMALEFIEVTMLIVMMILQPHQFASSSVVEICFIELHEKLSVDDTYNILISGSKSAKSQTEV